jgi:hypothetical protein
MFQVCRMLAVSSRGELAACLLLVLKGLELNFFDAHCAGRFNALEMGAVELCLVFPVSAVTRATVPRYIDGE